MSDLQLSSQENRTLAPEWDALGRLGQAFSVIWIWIALFLLYLFGVYMAFSTLDFAKLEKTNPDFYTMIHLNAGVFFAIYGLNNSYI